MVASFLRGLPKTSKDEGEETSSESPVIEFSWWVPWKAKICKTPEWWSELSTVPGKDDHRKLAREVRASFGLPCWMWELGAREATLQAPPAAPCLCRQKFMPPAESIYACRDIREVPREKVVAYARALQHWAEQNNLPAGGEPCLLAKSVLELREEVKWYLSFTDEEVFWGLTLPEKEEEESPKTPCARAIPRRESPEVFGMGEGTTPILTSGGCWGDSPTNRGLEAKSRIPSTLPDDTHKASSLPTRDPTPPKPSLPSQALAFVWPPTLLCSFLGVMACLQMLELVEVDLEAPMGTMPIRLVATPGISSMSASCIVKDEVTGITYLDTVTTSVGRVALSSPDPEACSTGPTIEDITEWV